MQQLVDPGALVVGAVDAVDADVAVAHGAGPVEQGINGVLFSMAQSHSLRQLGESILSGEKTAYRIGAFELRIDYVGPECARYDVFEENPGIVARVAQGVAQAVGESAIRAVVADEDVHGCVMCVCKLLTSREGIVAWIGFCGKRKGVCHTPLRDPVKLGQGALLCCTPTRLAGYRRRRTDTSSPIRPSAPRIMIGMMGGRPPSVVVSGFSRGIGTGVCMVYTRAVYRWAAVDRGRASALPRRAAR